MKEKGKKGKKIRNIKQYVTFIYMFREILFLPLPFSHLTLFHSHRREKLRKVKKKCSTATEIQLRIYFSILLMFF